MKDKRHLKIRAGERARKIGQALIEYATVLDVVEWQNENDPDNAKSPWDSGSEFAIRFSNERLLLEDILGLIEKDEEGS